MTYQRNSVNDIGMCDCLLTMPVQYPCMYMTYNHTQQSYASHISHDTHVHETHHDTGISMRR